MHIAKVNYSEAHNSKLKFKQIFCTRNSQNFENKKCAQIVVLNWKSLAVGNFCYIFDYMQN